MPPTKQVSTGAERQKAFRDRMTRMGMTIPRIYMTEGEQGLVREFLRHHRNERSIDWWDGFAGHEPEMDDATLVRCVAGSRR